MNKVLWLSIRSLVLVGAGDSRQLLKIKKSEPMMGRSYTEKNEQQLGEKNCKVDSTTMNAS
ncbi:hypothetical protein KIN20_023660 [Parelaphostrongylus tenuis]|uniref:Uncharacterized protein n=1 Tax=Parelaphostrongylus tenuis TaxID=148309 RepID=A0AAD5MS26_PARTN|nr:hypothetical protein KIN20_023660 [Parelaphostrongylus tenuis]